MLIQEISCYPCCTGNNSIPGRFRHVFQYGKRVFKGHDLPPCRHSARYGFLSCRRSCLRGSWRGRIPVSPDSPGCLPCTECVSIQDTGTVRVSSDDRNVTVPPIGLRQLLRRKCFRGISWPVLWHEHTDNTGTLLW